MSFKLRTGRHAGDTAIPGPFNGKVPGFDDCYLTDQRGFDSLKNASSRVHAEVILNFTEATPTMAPVLPFGATVDTVRLRVSTGAVLNTGRGFASGGFTKGPGFVAGSKEVEIRFRIAGNNPIAKMPRVNVVPPVITPPFPVPLPPSSSDPSSLADPDIDMIGFFVFDAQTRKLKFRATIDGFPFYEAYASVDGKSAVTIFKLSPKPGEDPLSGLPGLPKPDGRSRFGAFVRGGKSGGSA